MGCTGSKDTKKPKGDVQCTHCGKEITGQYHTLTLPGGKTAAALHEHCKDDWSDRHADRCDECSKPMVKTVTTITVDGKSHQIHPDCEKKWRQRTGNKDNAGRCSVCDKKFKEGEEVHSINCNELSEPAHVHHGCIEKLHKKLGRVCDQCGKAITGQLSTLTGSFGSAKLHTECVPKFKKAAGGR